MMGIYEILILVNLFVTVFLIFRVMALNRDVIKSSKDLNYLLEKENWFIRSPQDKFWESE